MINDNTGIGGYGSNDIGLTVGIELGNVGRSIEDATTLANRIKEWRTDNEAFISSLNDTQEKLQQLTVEFKEQNRVRSETVQAEMTLRDLSMQIRDNVRSTAQAYEEMNGVLSKVMGNFGQSFVPGMGLMNPQSMMASSLYGPMMYGMGSYNPFSSYYSNPISGPPSSAPPPPSGGGGGGGGGIPPASPGGGFSDPDDEFMNALDNAGLVGDPATPGSRRSPGSWQSKLGALGAGRRGETGEHEIQRFLSLPGWGRVGRIGSYMRYANRLTAGKLFKTLGSQKWLVGSRAWDKSAHDMGARMLAEKEIEDMLTSGAITNVDDATMTSVFKKYQNMDEATLRSSLNALGPEAEGEAAAAGALEGGLLSRAAAAAPVVGGAASAAYLGYQIYSRAQRMEQQYTGLTGVQGTDALKGALGLKVDAFARTFGGLNPRISMGEYEQIQNLGLAQGYKGNLLKQYEDVGYNAKSRYNISPQESLAMFHETVVKMGASVDQVSANLNQLANVTAHTNTSLIQAQKNQLSYSSILSSIGGRGGIVSEFATTASTSMAGDQILAKSPAATSMMQTIQGQAMTASAAGISVGQVYNTMHFGTSGEKMSLMGSSENYVRGILQRIVGANPQTMGDREFHMAVGSKAIQLMYVLNELVPPTGDQDPWNENTAVEYTYKLLKHKGGQNEAVIGGSIQKIRDLAGGNAIDSHAGLSEFFNNTSKELTKTKDAKLHGHQAETMVVRYKSQGHTVTSTLAEVNQMTDEKKLDIYKQIAASGKHLAQGYYDESGRLHTGTWKTLGSAVHNRLLQSIENGQLSQQQLLKLSPQAQWLVKLVKNPGKLTRSQLNYMATIGQGAGTNSWSNASTVDGTVPGVTIDYTGSNWGYR